jgi:hypothetical protein
VLRKANSGLRIASSGKVKLFPTDCTDCTDFFGGLTPAGEGKSKQKGHLFF